MFESSHGGSHHEDENLKSWTWFQSLYYALISLTTIGFGDFFMPSASDEHKVDMTKSHYIEYSCKSNFWRGSKFEV